MTAKATEQLEASAKEHARSRSAEIEALVDLGLRYHEINKALDAMRAELAEIAKASPETVMRKAGYQPHNGTHGTEWYPPGHPLGSRHVWLYPAKEETETKP